MGIRLGAENRFVIFRNGAFENEIKLMLPFGRIGFVPEDFGNMNKAADGDFGADFFLALTAKRLYQRFARILLAARQGKIMTFQRMMLFLNKKPLFFQNEGARCRPYDRAECGSFKIAFGGDVRPSRFSASVFRPFC